MNRLVGCYTNCFGPAGVRAAAERIRETGLDRLELALRPHNFGGLVIPESAVVTEKATDADASAFVDLLARHGVTISGCNVGGGDLLTPDGLDLTLRRLRFARRWFGVPVVVANAGQPGDETGRRAMVDNLRAFGDAAGELGVTVALETHKGPTQNADAMLRLMGDVGHDRVRLNFDTGNIAYYNDGADPVAELDRVKAFVANVHLKDNRGGFEDWYFPALGDAGAVRFDAARALLDSAGFAGSYTIEIEGIGGEPEPGLESRVDRISRSVRHLRAAGFFDPPAAAPR